MSHTNDDFGQGIPADWHVTELGQSAVIRQADGLHLTVHPTPARHYSDAQISDYRRRHDFRWNPPLTLTVRAYAAGAIQGTAGFGFWNHPFAPGERGFRPPKAVWFFFASAHSDMALARDVPGWGWKAATFDATRWQFLTLLPTAPLGFLLMRIPSLYRRLWPVGQRALGVSEHSLDTSLLDAAHDYRLDWQRDGVTFAVDGQVVHRADVSISGPLGFIAWVDNQYAIVTPQGRLGMGLVAVEGTQSLILEQVDLTRG